MWTRVPDRLERLLANTFVHRALHKIAFAAALGLCLLWGSVAALRAPAQAAPMSIAHEWPNQWDGAPLRPLALGEVEARFARQFPGQIARLTDGERLFVMRHVTQPTRMLHPAVDCYRALGWRIDKARLERDAQGRMWRCFNAARKGSGGLRVCERIEDAKGQFFTDTSAWYWAGASGRSTGPWQAVTVATPM